MQPDSAAIEGFRGTDAQASCIARVLSASQKYMRDQKVMYISVTYSMVACDILTVTVRCEKKSFQHVKNI